MSAMRNKAKANMKTLFLAAISVLSVSSAAAKPTTDTVSLDGKCDVYTLTSQDGGLVVWSAVSMNTGCDDGFGFGGVSKTKSLGGGTFLSMGMVLFASGDSELYTLQLQSPLMTGNAWYVFKSSDGINFTEVGSGTYTLGTDPSAHPQGQPAILVR